LSGIKKGDSLLSFLLIVMDGLVIFLTNVFGHVLTKWEWTTPELVKIVSFGELSELPAELDDFEVSCNKKSLQIVFTEDTTEKILDRFIAKFKAIERLFYVRIFHLFIHHSCSWDTRLLITNKLFLSNNFFENIQSDTIILTGFQIMFIKSMI
jgi:hypothetical protein